MDLKNKLKGLPHIYYFNLDNRIDRREYMESQFDHWGIKNYTRVSSSKYLASRHKEWKHVYIPSKEYKMIPQNIGNLITQIETIKNWLETTNDDYLILIEDDIDFSYVEYWHFDWEYLMNNIPYDWDCIQFAYMSMKFLPFFLHPKQRHSYSGPCMINRHYAKKLVKLHYVDGKYKVYNKIADQDFFNRFSPHFIEGSATIDYSITTPGRTYCIPLFSVNLYSPSYENCVNVYYPHHKICSEALDEWWKNDRDKFTLEDFFTYGKPYDHMMMKYVPSYPPPIGIL